MYVMIMAMCSSISQYPPKQMAMSADQTNAIQDLDQDMKQRSESNVTALHFIFLLHFFVSLNRYRVVTRFVYLRLQDRFEGNAT